MHSKNRYKYTFDTSLGIQPLERIREGRTKRGKRDSDKNYDNERRRKQMERA